MPEVSATGTTMATMTTATMTKEWVIRDVFIIGVAMLLTWFASKLASHRLYFRKLRTQGLPMPPHNIILGHLPVLIKVVTSMPSDAHPLYISTQMRKAYPDLGPEFYLDVWPFAPPMLVVGSVEILHQIAFDHILKKTEILKNYVRPLTDGFDIVSMDGSQWKKWRTIFNPGFSSSHLMTLVPIIVKETQTYCELLEAHAKAQDIFAMKTLTDNLILDVIGQVTLGVRFNCQKTFNKFIHSLRTQIKWFSTGVENNPINRYHPWRPFVHWYHSRIVNSYISAELQKRLEAWNQKSSKEPRDLRRTRTTIDLTLKAYIESQPDSTETANSVMNPEFRQMCMSQLKVFLFSGHDTTSSSLCYHFWLLAEHPEALKRLRHEHSTVFGSDPNAAASGLATSPHLLNQLPFTTAVIKESLRLFPTVTGSREGEANFNIVDGQGRVFPTRGVTVWPNQHSSHYDPAYWPSPEAFIPDRWLVDPEDPLYPRKGAWRAFEQGPRNCIAQELAMIEMKIALILVSRKFVIKPAYDELDAKSKGAQPTVLGRTAYQIDQMQPRGNLPVRVESLDRA